jgi:hypothetical protein
MAEDTIGGGASGAASGAMSGAMAGAWAGPIGMGIGAVIGGIFGSKKTKVKRPPTYSELMNNNLDAQRGIQDKLLSYEGEFRPKYQGLQERTLNTQLYGGQGTKGYVNMLNEANTALAGVQQNAANTYMDTLGGLAGRSRNLIVPQKVQTMQDMLFAQAQGELNAGTNLNAQDQRTAFQNANMAMAQRGLGGRQGVAAGVLANYGLGLQRQDRARQFAGNMMNSELGLQSQALQMAGNTMAQYNAGGAFMGQANQMLGQYQPQIFNPESQMGTQAQGMQYQHDMGLARAKLQQQQQLMQSMQSFGSFMMANPMGGMGGGGSIIPSNFGMGSGGASNFGAGVGQTSTVGSLSAGGASANVGGYYGNNYSSFA